MPHRYVTGKIKQFFIYRVLHVDDTPHRIALGVAIGIFIAWTPTVGLQMVLIVTVAAILRANKAVGVPFAWISNPFTIAPIYGFNYWLGANMLGRNYDLNQFTQFVKAATAKGTWFDRIHSAWNAMWTIFWPLWLGSVALGLLLGIISYFAIRFAVIRYRRFRHEHHHITTPADNLPPAEAKPDQPQDTPER